MPDKQAAAAPTVEELQKLLKESTQREKELSQKQEASVAAYRDLQSKRDKEREVLKAEAAVARQQADAQVAELMQALESQPEVKEKVELHQQKAKAAQFDQLRQRESQLTQAKEQYANAFGVPVEELAAATNPMEAFTLALSRRDAKHEAELLEKLGVKPSAGTSSEEGTSTGEAPKIPIAQGPSPDATLQSDQEWEKERQEIRDGLKTMEKAGDRRRARIEYLRKSKRGSGSSRRAQV